MVHKLHIINSCFWDTRKKLIESGGEPATTINSVMSEEELENFEKCWKEKWHMDKQEIISKVLEDIPLVEQMKKEEVEKI